MTESSTPPSSEYIDLPEWTAIAAKGGIHYWIQEELAKKGLLDDQAPSSPSVREKKQYRARRDEERRVRRRLAQHAWAAYRRAHLVHVGLDVFYHDTPDIDRYDVVDPPARRATNSVPEIPDARRLAEILDLPMPRLRWLVFHREVDSGTHYHRWTIPKRDGSERLISAPKPELKRVQKWISQQITEHLPVHGAAHGFLAARSTVTCAQVHAGARVLVKTDLKDFYPTITFPRVKGIFRKAGYGEQVATLLALLCTECPRDKIVRANKTYYVAVGPRSLPQGAPTSPSLTNVTCFRLDDRLTGLAKKFGVCYTRYADDLTFSWHTPGEASVGLLLGIIRGIVTDEGFELHPNKTQILSSGRRQKVTGLVVNRSDADVSVRVPRKVVRQLRSAIKNRENDRDGPESLAQLKGMAAYIHMADPVKGRQFLERIAQLEARQTVAVGSEMADRVE
ncbi:MAG: reverse transcriptase family protein [Myxococcales bacterium]|nr:reverse transcriptase family protein [Myxococcales bacterium]